MCWELFYSYYVISFILHNRPIKCCNYPPKLQILKTSHIVPVTYTRPHNNSKLPDFKSGVLH